MQATMLKHFDKPDEVRTFPYGRFEIVHLAGASLRRATYQPERHAQVLEGSVTG